MLAKHSDFVSFVKHSKIRGSHRLPKGEMEFVENAEIHPLIYMYMQETVRLEKEWKLV